MGCARFRPSLPPRSAHSYAQAVRTSLRDLAAARGGWRVNQMVPAVAYLDAQRVRGVMMQQLSDALGDFDAWVVPYGDSRARLSDDAPPPTPRPEGTRPSRRAATSQFFQLANHACYPAVALRNGFGDDGMPTGITFVGKPFAETKILSLAKAYQDSTDYHMRTPTLQT